MGQTLKPLVLLLKSGVQPGAAQKVPRGIILGDEAVERPVKVLERFDQAEDMAVPVINGYVLKPRSQTWRGHQSVGVLFLERKIDACDLIEIVEDHERRRVVF